MRLLPILPLILLLILAGCDAADPGDDTDPGLITAGILVAAQGAFGADDGGVVLFNVDGTSAARYEDLFVQSATVHDARAYVTSTDRIDVLDLPGLTLEGHVTGIPNPRYVAFSEQHAFVTSLYTDPATFGDGAVTRFTLSTLAAEEPVIIGGNPEGVALVGDRLFVANYDFGSGSTVTVLHAETMQELDRIDVGCDGPRMLFVDRQLEVQVVCEGNPWGDPATPGAIVTIAPETGTIVASTTLDTGLGTASLGQVATYVGESAEIYAISDQDGLVYRFDTNADMLTATLDVGGAPLNGVDYDPRRDYLYLARMNPTDPFTAQGTLTVHTREGVLVDSFHGAGVAPTHVRVLALEEE